ncbi:hypothetical protein [Mycobacteroides abscessus]|uniref:hypothetical protein n=1 Tax=Mycobacteroides abscessus TaxID=36809 RepID=UPI0009A7C234|nr:hypothetical protein [Mycobacteroides abscessus]SKF90139.1 Uncharacterised protein [Mycobacteroides abscessus subsp. bolletii]SKG25125.1 Uncharacterised protein [Mycobacteroides abscessus subsp. bolletii]SKH27166.1 Uncharacterised protein [Mycobacteroides abscessus subsp. bolletii]SKH59722.1 Uncharacterised protein [Mycobacteroides abscessus subsp. bolletii]SKH91099.1 Uncharacterised protein [Mycobacteroides abscessus subsp. bolletii]
MSATKHSARVFIVVDPVQDYEESLHILGVFGSLKTAQYATPRLMRAAWRWDSHRYAEVQEWRGDTLVHTWTYYPASDWQFTL